jgi:hypothetical protein
MFASVQLGSTAAASLADLLECLDCGQSSAEGPRSAGSGHHVKSGILRWGSWVSDAGLVAGGFEPPTFWVMSRQHFR